MSAVQTDGADVLLARTAALRGTVRLPGSKSLTNRALICAALADGGSTLRGASLSDDARVMLEALSGLGIAVQEAGTTLRVQGGGGQLPLAEATLDVGHAGTAMRFLTALLTLGRGEYRIDGSARMRQRPIGPLVDALRQLGAQIDYPLQEGFPPLAVRASGLSGGQLHFDAPPSSQFISALLLAAPYATDDVMIAIQELTSAPYIQMTLGVMRGFGVEAISAPRGMGGLGLIVPAGQRYRGTSCEIEPDASAATYFWALAAATGGEVTVAGLTRASLQGDAQFVDVLAQMGCAVTESAAGLSVSRPAEGGPLRGADVDLNNMPDTAQTLAVLALLAEGPTHIRNVPNLRIKETDRIAALATELRKFGARVEPRGDGLRIDPPQRDELMQSAARSVDTYDDHRMAMAFSIIGLARGGVWIRDAGCVSKSFPGYFERLAELASGCA